MIGLTKNTNDQDYPFSKEEIASFVQTMQDFKEGQTTARDWIEIEEELNRRYDADPPIIGEITP